jgi:hypothetical protein
MEQGRITRCGTPDRQISAKWGSSSKQSRTGVSRRRRGSLPEVSNSRGVSAFEPTLRSLYPRLEEVLGAEHADALMTYLPRHETRRRRPRGRYHPLGGTLRTDESRLIAPRSDAAELCRGHSRIGDGADGPLSLVVALSRRGNFGVDGQGAKGPKQQRISALWHPGAPPQTEI